MTERPTCQVSDCRRPVLDGYVCQKCADELTDDLHQVIAGVPGPLSSPFDSNGGLLADLLASYTRETRTGRGGAASETPLLFHEKAGELRKQLCTTMTRYALMIARARRVHLPDDADPITLASWLERHVPWLRHQPAGAEAVTDLRRLVTQIERVIDPIDDRQFIGLCTAKPIDGEGCQCACHVDRATLRRGGQRPLCDHLTCTHKGALCGSSLHADLRDVEITCPLCRQLYNVAEHRQWLLDKLADVLATATEISTALTSLDQPVTPERIRKWKQRNLLSVRGYRRRDGAPAEDAGDPVYLLGDVIALRDKAEAAAARRDARKAG